MAAMQTPEAKEKEATVFVTPTKAEPTSSEAPTAAAPSSTAVKLLRSNRTALKAAGDQALMAPLIQVLDEQLEAVAKAQKDQMPLAKQLATAEVVA